MSIYEDIENKFSVSIYPEIMTLRSGEEKAVKIKVITLDESIPGTYIIKLFALNGEIEKQKSILNYLLVYPVLILSTKKLEVIMTNEGCFMWRLLGREKRLQ